MSKASPLSYGQELFWLLDNATPGLLAYNVPRAFRIHGSLDVDALTRALNAFVSRHEVLRSVYTLQGDHPVQTVLDNATVPFEIVDLSSLPSDAREAELSRATALRADYHFNLAQDVLLRATLFRLADNEHTLVLLTHHIASDGWSKSITFRELGELYAAFSAQREPVLPTLPLQFAEYAVRQRAGMEGAEFEERLTYWREQLKGPLPVLDIQTDYPRPSNYSFDGDVRELVLPKSLVDGMRQLGQQYGATPYMVLLAAYQTLLHRYSGQDDIIVGSPTAGRDDDDTHDLIGYFAGALVLRTSFAGNPSFGELLERVMNTCLDAYEHQDIPFEKLVLELQKGEQLSHAPLFQCVLTMEDTIPAELVLGDTRVEATDVATAAMKFDFVMLFSERVDGLKLRLGFRTALFDGDRMARMLGHLQTLLQAAVADPSRTVSSLPLLTPVELDQLVAWNNTTFDEGAPTTVVELAERHAVVRAEQLAVVGDDASLTWGQLNEHANRIGHWLSANGATSSTPVGLLIDRSAELIAGMLGVLKSGAPYVPLVSDLPAARLADQARESGVQLVVTTAALWSKVESAFASRTELRVLKLDADADQLAALPGANAALRAKPEDLAYVLFTSGSTGVPKGVAVTHANLAHYVRAVSRRIELPLDGGATPWSFATVSTLGADLGHTAVFPALCSGGTLHVISSAVATDPTRFAQYVGSHGIDVLKITPNHLRALSAGSSAAAVLPKRWLVLGGEALSWDLARELVRAGSCRVLNHYGPTETTVGVCTFEVTSSAEQTAAARSLTVPIGAPLANTTAHILDSNGQQLPIGAAGELYIGGLGVARGYLGRDDLTRERFIPDTFSNNGARLYRTGDRARRLADGNIEFLGRNDHQVKVRGFRVELGEIEQVLSAHQGLDAAAVVLHTPESGDAQLVAYVVAKQGGYAVSHSDRPTPEGLSALLATKVPDYMVPSVFVFLDKLPLNANGKLDRAALPAPDAKARDEYVAPVTATEQTLAQIWVEILKRERIGTTDNFLALGGQSLLAIRVLGKISKQLGVRLPLRTLFEAPTVAELARVVEDAKREKEEAELLAALAEVEGLSDTDAGALLNAPTPPNK
ncbi:MAG: amino acid adenylation domain-containing protein [Gemmatimonadaceae bacterium]